METKSKEERKIVESSFECARIFLQLGRLNATRVRILTIVCRPKLVA